MKRTSTSTSFHLVVLTLTAVAFFVADGFTATVSSRKPRTTTASDTRRNLVEHYNVLQDIVANSDHHIVLSSTTQWLADATAAVVDEAAAKKDLGLWGSYIQLFKNSLSLVHSTVEGPLKSIGVEHSWGISIGIFTAAVRSLLLPLSVQQSKSAEYMKSLKPYVSDIKERFKNNEQAQNQAIGKLYSDANQNPLAGCLTSFAQLPVFLGLYRGVNVLAQENQLNEPFLWIPSLEGPVRPPDYRGLEWITEGWTDNGPALGWETTTAFLIMPVILVILQSITMQVLQPPLDENSSKEEKSQMETTQGVLRFLPILIGFFSLQVPAALTIYWFTSNIFTLTQSLAVRAYFQANPPKIELPEYWDSALSNDIENMTPEERRKASEAGISIGPTFEDLIDEAKFYCYIEREPLRAESAAWQLASMNKELPPELEEWVKKSGMVTAEAKA